MYTFHTCDKRTLKLDECTAANVEEKQDKQQQEKLEQSSNDSELEPSKATDFLSGASDFARREIEGLFRS